MAYANIIVETHGRVGLIRLNRPQRRPPACDSTSRIDVERPSRIATATAEVGR